MAIDPIRTIPKIIMTTETLKKFSSLKRLGEIPFVRKIIKNTDAIPTIGADIWVRRNFVFLYFIYAYFEDNIFIV